MNFHIPAEILDTALIFLLGMIWNGYRRIWRHIGRVEKRVLMIMIMLRDRGHEVPTERDTEVFKRANNLEGI